MHSSNRMTWERCSGRATDGIRQERYISVHSKTVVSNGRYSHRDIKTTIAVVSPLDYIRKQQVASIEKNRSAMRTCVAYESIFNM